MMTAYNSINGTPAILHPDVLRVVKGEWEMNGFIVSDAGDLIGLVKDHHYFETYKEAVVASIKNGMTALRTMPRLPAPPCGRRSPRGCWRRVI